MSEIEQAPPGVDITIPSPARMYDYYLGGKDNYEVDRKAAEAIREKMPELEDAAWANRGFLQRSVRWLAEHGVRQFLDIGAGLPTMNNTHDAAQAVAPDAKVVYVDNDPIVQIHANALLEGVTGTAFITADFRDIDGVLGHEDTLATIDFDKPVALLLLAVTHFMPDEDDPWGLIRHDRPAVREGGRRDQRDLRPLHVQRPHADARGDRALLRRAGDRPAVGGRGAEAGLLRRVGCRGPRGRRQ